ncbi:MAG TPA: DUF6770 family protein [Puia sp.]|nr:DUF6770 family protein [Puia sp.]
MKNTIYVLFLLLIIDNVNAQTKVFRQVVEDMSTQLETIRQDGNLVGYLAFNQLERSSEDSFHYRINIMDENLNDIGSVEFKEEKLFLKAVAFEGDVLCLAYIKSNFAGREFRTARQVRQATEAARTSLFTQFIGLNGKIIGGRNFRMDVKPDAEWEGGWSRKMIGNGRLKQPVQLRNITGKGFACFYGDDSKNRLLVLNTNGTVGWQKVVHDDAEGFNLLTSGPEVSLLLKKKDQMVEGGFELLSYNSADSSAYPRLILKDRKGNSLKVLAFDNDPVTGKPYVSGMIIDPNKGNDILNGKQLSRGPYVGVFTINLNGHKRADIQTNFSYWADGSKSFVDKYGLFTAPQSYARLESCFKDYEGNTWFTGSGVTRQTRWGIVAASIVTAPTVLIPAYLMIWGTQKCSLKDALLLKLDSKGGLSLENTIPTSKYHSVQGKIPFSEYPDRASFYPVTNSDTRTDYIVIDDTRNIFIYNVNQKKIARTIPHEDATGSIAVFPAKEGSVMVYEYNRKEKTTRLSIESL